MEKVRRIHRQLYHASGPESPSCFYPVGFVRTWMGWGPVVGMDWWKWGEHSGKTGPGIPGG